MQNVGHFPGVHTAVLKYVALAFVYKGHKHPSKNPKSTYTHPLPNRYLFRTKQNAFHLLLLCSLFVTEVEVQCLIRDNPGCQMNLFEIFFPLSNCILARYIPVFQKCMKTSSPLSLLPVSHVLRGQMTCSSFLILWNERLIESCDVS